MGENEDQNDEVDMSIEDIEVDVNTGPLVEKEDESEDSTGVDDNKDTNEADGAAESIRDKAKREFDRPEYQEASEIFCRPIQVRNFSVKKDVKKKKDDDGSGLQMAPTFASAVMGKWVATKLGMGGKPPPKLQDTIAGARTDEEYIIRDADVLLNPGECTLLLGPSSSGKTTLMRTICDVMTGQVSAKADSLEGEVKVGAIADPSQADTNLSRSAAFVDQSDLTLTPILTVDETVRFARRCAEGKLEFMDESIDNVFQLTGLDHVTGTVVGDADIRGVSGGQKRRVKLLEQAVGINMTTIFMDEITNGLDAASAFSICKVIRVGVETNNTMAVVCLLQPSTDVFNTFHRLVLLTPDGKIAYSGKRDGAISHFESLGLIRPDEMNEPEFLLRCASSPTDFWDEESKGEIPASVSTSDNLAESFKKSDAGKALIEEMDRVGAEEEGKAEEIARRQADWGRIPAFAQPISGQIALLMGRGFKLVRRNPATIMRIASAVIFGLFVGTLFLQTSSDATGTFLRAGYILTLIFLAFLNACMAPIDDLFADRITFYTHRRASFYRTASYYLSQVITSWPVGQMEAFFQTVLSFFLVGMNNNGGWVFFYFWALFALLTMCGTAVSRILAYSLPAPDIAQNLGPAALLLFVMGSCYSPQYLQLPTWLRWLGWFSPCAYCYEGTIVAEVSGRNVGEVAGKVWAQENLGIPRLSYATAPPGLSTEGLVLAFNIYMLIVWTIVFEVIGCCLLHQSQKWYGPTTKRHQVSSGMALNAPPWQGSKKVTPTSEVEKGDSDNESSIPPAPSAHLTAKDTVYEVEVPIVEEEAAETEKKETAESDRAILEEDPADTRITAREYGQAGRGAAKEWAIKRIVGEDALSSRSAGTAASLEPQVTELDPPEPGRLRLLSGITASFEPGTMTALMGSSGAGKSTLLDVLAGYKTGGFITGEIRINGKPKTDDTWRSIAGYCEQVDLHNPAMTVRESLVFAARMRLRPFTIKDQEKVKFASKIIKLLELDEFADMLVGDEASGEGLPKHARKRLTVGVELAGNPSILFADEPTSGLDSLSAAVVVSSLERAAKQEGLTVVCTIHQPSQSVFESFDNLLLLRKGGVCVYNGKISDLDRYMQTAPNGQEYAMPEEANPADHVLEVFCGPRGENHDWGEFYKKSDMATEALNSFERQGEEISVDTKPQGFMSELYIVFQRQVLAHWRTPTYMAVRFWWTVVANVMVGAVYFQTQSKSDSPESATTNVVGAIFFFVNIATVPLLSAVVPLISERAVFYREIASGTYQREVYGIAVQLAELPFNIGCAIISFVIFYFMVGLTIEGERVIYFILMALGSYWILPTFGQLFAFLSPNIGAAVGIGSLLMTLLTLTMGFLIPPNDIPPWYIWIYWINPLRYILQGMVSNEIGGTVIGDLILDVLGWSMNDRWWYCFVAVMLFGIAASIGIVAATRISWLQR